MATGAVTLGPVVIPPITIDSVNNRIGIGGAPGSAGVTSKFSIYAASAGESMFLARDSANGCLVEIISPSSGVSLIRGGGGDVLALASANGTNDIYIDTNHCVGMGAASLSANNRLHVSRAATTTGHHAYISVATTGATHGESGFLIYEGSDATPWYIYRQNSSGSDNHLRLDYGGTRFTFATNGGFAQAANVADFCAVFFNDGNNANRKGIAIQCGEDTPASATSATFIEFLEGDGTSTGSITANASGVVALNSSDLRKKKDIRPTEVDALSVIQGLELIQFNWKKSGQSVSIGFSAQNVLQAFPEASGTLSDDTLAVSSTTLIPVLCRALQQLLERIQKLEEGSHVH
jgi:hypothetical protein